MTYLGRLMAVVCFVLGNLSVSMAMTQETTIPHIEKVAETAHQWTGVAVSKKQRIFVNFPTWDDHPDYKVAELQNHKEMPYPDKKIQQTFICVQSVVIDKQDQLWILDPAKLRGHSVDPSGAKLFKVNLKTNRIDKTYLFPKTTALPQSYMNDVRIDKSGSYAYITDSGLGGIIVLDLASGMSWRALSDISEVKANLSHIDFPSTGPMKHVSQSDGIELSADEKELYFTALGGTILYSIPVQVLQNPLLTIEQRRAYIHIINPHHVPTDGMVLREGKLYMANLPEEAIWEFTLSTKQGRTLRFQQPIRWADSFALAPDGSIYFTTSQINYPVGQRQSYGLYRLIT